MRLAILALGALLLLPALPAQASPRVLMLWDARNEQTGNLAKALRGAGLEVVLSQTNESGFHGENPTLKDFDVVIHLNGTTWRTEMPIAGQKALERFVREGGGYIHHEWNAYQLSVGQLKALRPLILFDRRSGFGPGSVTIRKVANDPSHPVIWEVPGAFVFKGATNIGKVHVFDKAPAMVLARDDNGNDAIAVREYGLGRVVGFHHGGNWEYASHGSILDSSNARRLFVDAVRWAYGCEPGFREGRREKICAEIARRKAAR